MSERGVRQPAGLAAGWIPLLAVVLFTAAAGAHRVAAQTQPPPTPAVLNSISAAPTGHGEALILLTFAPHAPRFSIIADGTDNPSIAFALSSRGPTARAPAALHGLLRSVAFEQSQTILILHFATAGKTHIAATPVGDTTISITLSPPAQAESVAAAQTGGLPAAAQHAPGEDGFEVVFLKYADVSEIVGLLTDGLTVKSNDSFAPYEPAFGSAGLGGSMAAYNPPPPPSASMTDEPLAQGVDDTIAIDRRLNAIILKGSPERIARLKEKIAQIDVPVRSVLLETVFVELDETGAKNVGLNFNNASNQVLVATYQTGAFIPPGAAIGRELTSVSLQAAIAAQVQSGHGKIVSQPRIAAQSGSTAKIITGDALPILTAIALSGVNAVSQQVQYVNVGVTLQIAPRVSDDGFVTSHVFCVVSSVTGTSQGYPTISQREAETSATVHDGETFVIGGLTEESNITSNTDLPIIGKVPILNELLGMRTWTRAKTDLYIVVTPHIVRGNVAALNAAVPSPPR